MSQFIPVTVQSLAAQVVASAVAQAVGAVGSTIGAAQATADSALAIATAGKAEADASAALVGHAGGLATLDDSGVLTAAQIPPAISSGRHYLGTWNAATNTPTLANGTGTQGDYYTCAVAGTVLGATFAALDQVAYSGSVWQRLPAPNSFGTMALQNANAVAVTGGAVTGATQLNVLGGSGVEYGESPYPLTFPDAYGLFDSYMRTDGSWVLPRTTIGALDFGTGNITLGEGDIAGASVVMMDGDGFYVTIVSDAGVVAGGSTPGGGGSGGTGFTSDEILSYDALALARSAQVKSQVNTEAPGFFWQYNHAISYGQSLSNGTAGWPPSSTTQPYDNKMLGGSVRPNSGSSTSFVPIGAAVFNPLVAVVNEGAAILTAPQIAALDPSSNDVGETILEGALNLLKRMYLIDRGLLSDASRLLVGSACGVGGQSIAQLSKGADPNLYNRLPTCCSLVKAAAGASTYGVLAMLLSQGEQDYTLDTDKDAYKAAVNQLYQDFAADCAVGIAGQSYAPAMFMSQAGGRWAEDGVAVGQAQLELAQENSNWYLVGPSYPVTNQDDGHLDGNGYRWQSNQFGKVMYRVLIRRENWLPLHPFSIVWRDDEILMSFHVPEPPLAFDSPFVGWTATDFTGKGFSISDDLGSAAVVSVEIVGQATVRIKANRTLTNPVATYGGASTFAGNGCLRDSDPFVFADEYEYSAGSGQPTDANITALVGKPYPAWNWCVAFNIAAVAA